MKWQSLKICQHDSWNNSPVLSSHSLIDLSLPSMSPDKRTFPSGSNFSNVTGALWPGKTERETIKSNQLKIMLFHIRIESHKLTVKFFFFRFEKKNLTCKRATTIASYQVPNENSRVFKASNDACVGLWNGEWHRIARWLPLFEQCATLQVIHDDKIGWRILKLFSDDADVRSFMCYCRERCDEL